MAVIDLEIDYGNNMPYYHGILLEYMLKNFHVPLPIELYELLKENAKDQSMPATKVVRRLIEHWIELRKRKKIQEEFSSFARKYAGSEYDLDEDLERMSLEVLDDLEI